MTIELAAQIAASPFARLGLAHPLVRATFDESYVSPSPVQSEVVPHALAGRDVLACAQTGTGKTAAFVLPILQLLSKSNEATIRALVLTPTRELAAQIGERAGAYGRHLDVAHTVVYGGVSQFRQERALRERPSLLIATPGRLLDLIGQKLVSLRDVRHFVLDEADRMLDMGFIHDVRRIVAMLPQKRQTLFFSATMAPEVVKLASTMLENPARVSIAPAVTTAPTIDQSVIFVSKPAKKALLQSLLEEDRAADRVLVFTRTKVGANRLSERLDRAGIRTAAIHGNKSQGQRERALAGFKNGDTRVLVATDIAARGIDVDGVSLVVNFDIPNEPESYVHRIGRTGRAGATGRAISFCDTEERPLLADIERLIKTRLRSTKSDIVVEPAAAPTAPQPVAVATAPVRAPQPPVAPPEQKRNRRRFRPRRYRGARV